MANVVLENVVKRFGSVVAVNDVSLTIEDGEFLVLIGPSGCGKSTTLRMIAGLEPVTAGSIKFDGRIVNDLPPKHRDIAMVFQSYALYPHMTVFHNMAFGLKLKRVKRDEIQRRVQQAAQLLNIEELLRRKPRELSGGQRQRVAMGRAIVRQPKAFLFDEPLSNLDANLRAQMRVEIKKLHHKLATTIVYVTHDHGVHRRAENELRRRAIGRTARYRHGRGNLRGRGAAGAAEPPCGLCQVCRAARRARTAAREPAGGNDRRPGHHPLRGGGRRGRADRVGGADLPHPGRRRNRRHV
jgi:ABC-type Fe3+/spermidine/putrescine transport system ATPase subunit